MITDPQPIPLAIAQTLARIGRVFTRNDHVGSAAVLPQIDAAGIVVIQSRECGGDHDQPAALAIAFDLISPSFNATDTAC